MNIKISRRQTIIYILLVLVIGLLLSIWPCRIIHRNVNVKSSEEFAMESQPVTVEQNIAQVFVSDGSELESVNLYICNDMAGETINFSIYDANLTRIYTKDTVISEKAEFPGMINIPVEYDLERGVAYIYTLYGVSDELTVGLQDKDPVNSITVGGANYAGEEDPSHDVILNFNYIVDFTLWQIIIIYLVIILGLVGVIVLINKLTGNNRLFGISEAENKENKWNNDFITVQRLLQCTVIPVTVIIAAVSLWAVFPQGLFGTDIQGIICYYIGILLLSAIIIYGICYKRDGAEPLISIRYVMENYQKWLIVAALGHVFWYCFEYMNGLYEIHHAYASRRILIWIFLTLIFTYSKKELFNIINLVWLVAAGIYGYYYAKPYFGVEEKDLLYKLTAYAIVFGGLVAINMIRTIIDAIRKKAVIKKISWINLAFFVIFSVVIIAFANTRWWPAYMVTICALVLFRLLFWKDADKYLMYLCNGLIFNFAMMVIFSLAHRPYYRFVYYRYNMTYFTVTMTATHMSLIVCALLVKMIIKLRDEVSLKTLIPDMAIFGMAVCYQLFTMSRTAFFCIGVTGIITMMAATIFYYRKGQKVKMLARALGVMLVSTFVMFPITFTATRILPAVINDPVIYDYEYIDNTIYKGTKTDDFKYMDISRFLDVFGSKTFGIGKTITSLDYDNLPEEFYFREVNVLVSANEDSIGDVSDSSNETISEIDQIRNELMDMLLRGEVDEVLAAREEYYYLTDEEFWLWINGQMDIEVPADVSNGRMDIYESYMEQLNLWGHSEMGAILQDGSEAAHAHSIYLQIMYDFGIIPGLIIILFMVYMGIVSLIRLIKEKERNAYTWLTPVAMLGFLAAGTVEWIFHACNPFGMAVMLAILPMLYKVTENEESI